MQLLEFVWLVRPRLILTESALCLCKQHGCKPLFIIIMPSASDILEFKISNFNRVAATVGGFLSVFGLVSYLLKEKFHFGEACM